MLFPGDKFFRSKFNRIFKKIIFIESSIRTSADINQVVTKCLNFENVKEKLIKNYAKSTKCVFLTAELRKIFGPKNKKTPNNVSFLFYMHVVAEKSTAHAKFGKNPKKGQN